MGAKCRRVTGILRETGRVRVYSEGANFLRGGGGGVREHALPGKFERILVLAAFYFFFYGGERYYELSN